MALLGHFLTALKLLVLMDAALSWIVGDEFPRSLTKPLLDPVYAPLRSALAPLTGAFDLSPLIVLLLLHMLQRSLRREDQPGKR